LSASAARIVLALMALGGLWAAVTMTGTYYGWWRGPAWLVPERLCSPKVGGCMDILMTPYARVFGPPNSLLGIMYYVLMLGLAGTGHSTLGPAVLIGLQLLAWAVVAFSIYLAWSLLFKLRTPCVLCFFSQALNLLIALLLTLAP